MRLMALSARRMLAVALLAATLMSAAVAPVEALPPQQAEVTITGSGWGHGVGLSQYGAKAMGADGNTYQEIVARYFNGVSIVPVESASPFTFVILDPRPLLVGLLQDSQTIAFTVESGSAQLCFDLTGSCQGQSRPGVTYRFGPDSTGGCVFMETRAGGATVTVGGAGPCAASVRPTSDSAVISIPFKARSYRSGRLLFRQTVGSDGIHAVYQIGIEQYMRGLSEVPESWSMAAIEAQVVVSRSAAVWTALQRGGEAGMTVQQRRDCYCNLRDDSSDQVFRGWTGEAAHPRWVEAVSSTAGQVMAYGGSVARGLYSSSSGGFTENYSDVFGDTDYPYLSTVNDSPAFSESAANPHSTWAAGYSRASLADTYGFSWLSNAEVQDRNDSGSARTMRLSGIVAGRPEQITVEAAAFQSSLGLRSTTFDISVTGAFVDVASDHLFSGEITGLKALGISDGCGTGDFCPDREVTRAEMAAFLTRALDLPPTSGVGSYEDDDGHALEAEIASLQAAGITTGCTTTAYCPERQVTRAEMAAFIVRGFSLPPSSQNPFPDADGHALEAEIAALEAAGITTGCTPTRYCPERQVTRAEMAAFLIRALAD